MSCPYQCLCFQLLVVFDLTHIVLKIHEREWNRVTNGASPNLPCHPTWRSCDKVASVSGTVATSWQVQHSKQNDQLLESWHQWWISGEEQLFDVLCFVSYIVTSINPLTCSNIKSNSPKAKRGTFEMSFEPVGGIQYLNVWPCLIAVYNIRYIETSHLPVKPWYLVPSRHHLPYTARVAIAVFRG